MTLYCMGPLIVTLHVWDFLLRPYIGASYCDLTCMGPLIVTLHVWDFLLRPYIGTSYWTSLLQFPDFVIRIKNTLTYGV